MARPTTKTTLIDAANTQFNNMRKLIGTMPDNVRNAEFNFGAAIGGKKEAHWTRDCNLRDVLVHLHEWHVLLLNWVEANRAGEAKPFLPAPYTWKTYGDMNVEFWKKHRETLLGDAEHQLRESHARVMHMIEGFSDEELFEKKHFSWTGTTTLGSYCISAAPSHYDWAMKKLKLHIKTCS